jgi:hypothetical protein
LPEPGSPERPSLFAHLLRRIVFLFTSPSRAFEPPQDFTLWLVPLVLIAVINVVEPMLLKDLYLDKMRHFAEETTLVPESQKELFLKQIEESGETAGPLAWVTQAGSVLVTLGLLYFLPAGIYLLGLNFGLGGTARYADVLCVVCFSSLLLVAREIVTVPLKLERGSLAVFASPAAFVPADKKLLLEALNVLDIFHLYRLFLIIIGFSVVARVSVRNSAILVVALWGLWSLCWVFLKLSPIGPMLPALLP